LWRMMEPPLPCLFDRWKGSSIILHSAYQQASGCCGVGWDGNGQLGVAPWESSAPRLKSILLQRDQLDWCWGLWMLGPPVIFLTPSGALRRKLPAARGGPAACCCQQGSHAVRCAAQCSEAGFRWSDQHWSLPTHPPLRGLCTGRLQCLPPALPAYCHWAVDKCDVNWVAIGWWWWWWWQAALQREL